MIYSAVFPSFILAVVLVALGLFLGLVIMKALYEKRTEQDRQNIRMEVQREFEAQIPSIRAEAVARSRSVLTGKFSENLAPYFPDFPFTPNEARFLGNPIDFIVFQGMDQGKVEKIVFVEVKTGKSNLNQHEKLVKEAVESKRVEWVTYRIPQGIQET